MNSLSPSKAPDPSGPYTTGHRIHDTTPQGVSVNESVANCDSAVRLKASSPVMDNGDRPTTPAPESHEELVLCAVEAHAISLGDASVAVKTGLLTAEQLMLAEARFFDRFGYQHFAAQMRGAR